MDNLYENINLYISREEIFDCIKNLKNDKASGEEQKNGLMWPYGLKFSEYSKVFRIGTKSVTQNRCKKFPQAT
jgi:hypothetical protein